MRIAFAGLGSMGTPMAANLAAAGHHVTGFRRPSKNGVASAAPAGVTITSDLAAAVRGADVLVTMLPNDDAVREVVLAAVSSLAPGSLHCAMSTTSPELARSLAGTLLARGVTSVAAPVFGRPNAAADKRLWIVAAGKTADLERCRPLFEAMGRGVTIAGEDPGSANLIKIGGNFLIVSMIEALGESMTLMRKSAVPPEIFLEAIENVFQSPIVKNYGTQIAQRNFTPGFQLSLGLKDVRLALDAGEAAHAALPLASLLEAHLLAAVANGDGALDWTAMTEVVGRMTHASAPGGTQS